MSRNLFYTDVIAKAETDDFFEVEGLASTPDKDLQDEIIDQNGLDISDVDSGKMYFIDDHGQGYQTKSHARMGVIDEAKLTKDGLWIKGKIWKNHPASTAYYNEIKYKPGMVQYSVEGSVVERDPFEKGKIKRAKVSGVALTRNPVNPKTYASLVKSLCQNENESKEECNLDLKKIEIFNDKDKLIEIIKSRSETDESFKDAFIEIIKGGLGSGRKIGSFHLIRHLSNGKKEIVNKFDKYSDALKDMNKLKSSKDPIGGEDRPMHIEFIEDAEKALVPGGAQYANAPNTISGGSIFMTEDNENSKRKKKKINKNKEIL